MNQLTSAPLSFALLWDPASVIAAAERAAKWNLPRRVCRPLDRRMAIQVNAEVAAFDAQVEETTFIEEDTSETTLDA